ncbi:MAG TPA: AbrB/MazE/SpoVT family DNA-binding domain-containing protein [Pantanalinema sp.]
MHSTVSKRGQTVVPAELRRKYGIDEGSVLAWVETPQGIRVLPLPADPLKAFRGSGRGLGTVADFLAERQAETAREEETLEPPLRP